MSPAGFGSAMSVALDNLRCYRVPLTSAIWCTSRVHRANSEGALRVEAVRKRDEISQTIEQSKIFRDFSDSKRSKASKKRTKQVRVKMRGSFYTAWVELSRS
jgi:hypothetical protein